MGVGHEPTGSTRRPRLVVLASGSGSNLQAVLDACSDGRLPAQVVAVVCNKGDARALRRAADVGVPAVHVAPHPGEERTGDLVEDKNLGR